MIQQQGKRLSKLWSVQPRPTAVGKSKGGRKAKSGRQMIEDAAAAILHQATPAANPAAEALGLGPCLIGKGVGKDGEGGRPRHHFTSFVGKDDRRVKFGAMAYHVTWCAAAKQPPPGIPGHGWSHRCHNPRCVEPRHGLWQSWTDNVQRDGCADDAENCPHDPVCIPCPKYTA